MKEMKLNHGLVALLDDEDFDRLDGLGWFAHRSSTGKWYVRRNVTVNGRRTTSAMAREVLGVSDRRVFVDHKDRNPLNNQIGRAHV